MADKDSQNSPEGGIPGLFGRIVQKATAIMADDGAGPCLFRGESREFDPMLSSSGLHREVLLDPSSSSDGEESEPADWYHEWVFATAVKYLKMKEKIAANGTPLSKLEYHKESCELMAKIQHYGGVTNFLDFTRDYLIALFFACYESSYREIEKHNGRIILLSMREAEQGYPIYEPESTEGRIAAQKTVLVRLEEGCIELRDENHVIVPKHMKLDILDYLLKFHGISDKTVFVDLHGYVKTWNTSWFRNSLALKGAVGARTVFGERLKASALFGERKD